MAIVLKLSMRLIRVANSLGWGEKPPKTFVTTRVLYLTLQADATFSWYRGNVASSRRLVYLRHLNRLFNQPLFSSMEKTIWFSSHPFWNIRSYGCPCSNSHGQEYHFLESKNIYIQWHSYHFPRSDNRQIPVLMLVRYCFMIEIFLKS